MGFRLSDRSFHGYLQDETKERVLEIYPHTVHAGLPFGRCETISDYHRVCVEGAWKFWGPGRMVADWPRSRRLQK